MNKHRLYQAIDAAVLGLAAYSAMTGFTNNAILGIVIYLTLENIKKGNIDDFRKHTISR